ncbi:sensor histidine kinase [Planosporangium sp. 12N6]|uniref:sensor histidine kinase n=1 Tax=Planosporangium spinosum TaxID=3402278 RepID=UPI003CF67E32
MTRTRTGGVLLGLSLVAVSLSAVDLRLAVTAPVTALLAGLWLDRLRTAVLGFAATLGTGAVLAAVVPSPIAAGSRLVAVAVFGGMLPWLVGLVWRQSRELVRTGWERAAHLERAQWLAAEQARMRERARIAQDMHDALGHDLSLLALRAGALTLAADLPERHRAAAGDLRAGAAAAVARLGEVIGVLRTDADPAPARPAGTDVADLVAGAATSGLDVRLVVEGDPAGGPLPEHAVYRVVQEALTNVAKHAPDAATTVRIAYPPDGVEVEVVNEVAASGPRRGGRGGPRTAPKPGGYGLAGLRERVRLAGGTFTAGPHDGGFAVVARLPRTAVATEASTSTATAAASTPVSTPTTEPSPTSGHLRRARRRVGRAVLAAAVVPLLTFTVLTGVLWGWSFHVTGQAVLDRHSYAALRVGQTRAEIGALLPRRQAPQPPPAPRPPGEGVTCEYYAMTRNPFDNRSGDAYRLCFRAEVLITLDTLTW